MGEEFKEGVTIEFSADGKKMETGLANIESKAKKSGERIEKSVSLKGERAVTSQAKGFIEDLAHAKSGTDILTSGVNHLSESLKESSLILGVGVAAAVTVGVSAWEGYTEAVDKARDAQIEMDRISTGGTSESINSSIEKYTQLYEGLAKTAKDANRNFFTKSFDVAGGIVAGLTGNGFESGSDKDLDKAEEARNHNNILENQLTGTMREQVSIRQKLLEAGDRESKETEFQITKKQTIADISAKGNIIPGVTEDQTEAEIKAASDLFDVEKAIYEKKEDQAQADRDLGIFAQQAASDEAAYNAIGDAAEAKHIAESQRLQEARLKIQHDADNGLITQDQMNDALRYQGDLYLTNSAIINRDESIRKATLDTETKISTLTGTATKRKIDGLRAEMALQVEIATTVKDQVIAQNAANKAVEIQNQLIDAEIAARHQTGQQRAAETRQNNARNSQRRVDATHAAADAAKEKASGLSPEEYEAREADRKKRKISEADYPEFLRDHPQNIPKPMTRVQDNTASVSGIGQAVGAALAQFLSGKMMVVKEAR